MPTRTVDTILESSRGGTRLVRTRLMVKVAGWLDLDGAVLDIEMADEARLQFVEDAGYATVGEARIIDDHVR